MPRKRATVRDQQVYKLAAYGAVVTIDYDTTNPPPFFQPESGVVIVGQHQCSPAPMVLHDPSGYGEPAYGGRRENEVPRGGNFGVDENDPTYVAFKEQQQGGGGKTPAPPGVSPKVYTSEENFAGMKAGSGELTALLGAPAAGDVEPS